SVLLAETAASIAGFLNIDQENQSVFGIEINANHIKSKKDGSVFASATPYHVGKRTMVWDIEITDEKKQLVCISRCTLGVVDKRLLNGWCYNNVYISFHVHEHPTYKLVVIANRDEQCKRSTAQAHFWEDEPDILAGRDLEAMGT